MKNNPKITLFGIICKQKSPHPLFGAWSLLLVHVWFTPSQGAQKLLKCVLSKSDRGSVTMKKYSLTWDNFMVHDVNKPQTKYNYENNLVYSRPHPMYRLN